jgi:hypothetical protein
MSKNINYYSGLALSLEELSYKDYSDKYMSLYVDLIRAGSSDVIFLKNTSDFQMEKITGGSVPSLRVKDGFCLFQRINETVPFLDYQKTLDIENYPDQRFFIRSSQKDEAITAGTIGEKRYIYLKSYMTPAGFTCTVAADGVVTILDGGSIKKSETGSILRDSNTSAPTTVRFLKTDYTTTGIQNTGTYEVNSFDDDLVVLNGSILAEAGEVLCVPLGSFDLGIANNLSNRCLFSNLETKLVISSSDDLDSEAGVIKIGYIEFSATDDYDIIDLRNDSKYIITIDTDVDLSDFVTKSTNQSIEGEKYFRALTQGRLTTLTHSSNFASGLINIDTSGGANDFVFDCQNVSNLVVNGFYHSGKPFGLNPLINIVPGTSIRVRFINVGSNSKFTSLLTDHLPLHGVALRTGVLYTIRYEETLTSGIFTVRRFSLSDTASIWEINNLQTQITQNANDINTLEGIVSGMEFVVKAELPTLVGGVENTTVKLYYAYIRQGANYLVTLHAKMDAGVNLTLDNNTIPDILKPGSSITNSWATISTEDRVYIRVPSSGQVSLLNETGTSNQISVTYIAGI